MDEKTDGELVVLSRSGNKEAFNRLLGRYQDLALRIALRMVGNSETAQELVQEAMLQAFLSIQNLQDKERFRSWFYGIVINVCKNFIREDKWREQAQEGLDEVDTANLWTSSEMPANPQDVSDERAYHHLVLSIIHELPAKHRDATLLYYYQSLTMQEVAAIMGISLAAVKVRLHRARNQLREQLQPAYPDVLPRNGKKPRRKTMIEMTVSDVIKQDVDSYVVLLTDKEKQKILRIWVGPYEGASIALGMRAYPTRRPMTYNFIASLLSALDARLEEARIEVLKDEIFYGVARLRTVETVKELDARPSDILALAVRTGCPILVSEDVMEQAGKDAGEEEMRTLSSGEGVEEILKEFEEKMKKMLPPHEEQT